MIYDQKQNRHEFLENAAYEKMTDGFSLSEQDAVFRSNAAEWFFDRRTPSGVA